MAQHDIIATRPGLPETIVETTTGASGGLAPVTRERTPAEMAEAEVTRVALIDSIQFSQDCLSMALQATHPDLLIVPFDSVSACLQTDRRDFDAILYCAHDDRSSEHQMLHCVAELKQAFAVTPVVVLSDSQAALQPQSIRNALKCGVRGFIPTINTRVPSVLAAIRFITDGGTFAPLDLLLPSDAGECSDKTKPATPHATDTLTPRQKAVLSHLKQGKANKIIAYELSMSESTVKIHIRNIMRKMGATNRTQAVYKSQQFGGVENSWPA